MGPFLVLLSESGGGTPERGERFKEGLPKRARVERRKKVVRATNTKAPRLKIEAVGGAGNFTKIVPGRHPSLDIELTGSRCAEVIGGHIEDSEVQTERLQKMHLELQQFFMNTLRVPGVTDHKELHLE